jgi:hypothetical protein
MLSGRMGSSKTWTDLRHDPLIILHVFRCIRFQRYIDNAFGCYTPYSSSPLSRVCFFLFKFICFLLHVTTKTTALLAGDFDFDDFHGVDSDL